MTTATRTLDAAQQAGIAAVDQAVAQALRNLQAVKAQQARIYEAVGLDPSKRYSIDRESGEVTEQEGAPS